MSKTTKCYNLEAFKGFGVMHWCIGAQCDSKGTITLSDESNLYFYATKSINTKDLQVISSGTSFYNSKEMGVLKLQVEVDYPNADLEFKVTSHLITAKDESEMGYAYTICVEDNNHTVPNIDFGDYRIDITFWKQTK